MPDIEITPTQPTSRWSKIFSWTCIMAGALGSVAGVGYSAFRLFSNNSSAVDLSQLDTTLLPAPNHPDLSITTSATLPRFNPSNVANLDKLTHPLGLQATITEEPTFNGRKLLSSLPSVINPIPTQVIEATTAYSYSLDVKNIFSDDAQFLGITEGMNKTILPSWLSFTYPPARTWSVAPSCSYFGASITDISMVGDIAFISCLQGGIISVNLTNLTHPILLDFYPNPAISTLITTNHSAYGISYQGLYILNITNPSNITFVNSYSIPVITIINNIVYMNNGTFLLFLNITDPFNLVPLGGYYKNSTALINNLLVKDKTAYVTFGTTLAILNITNFTSVQLIGNYSVLPSTSIKPGIDVSENLLIFNVPNSLKILNITDPVRPTLAGSYRITNPIIQNFKLLGNLLLVPTSTLTLLDVTDPTSPKLIGSYDAGYSNLCWGQTCNSHLYITSVLIKDNTVFVWNPSTWDDRLRTLDLSKGVLSGTPTSSHLGVTYHLHIQAFNNLGNSVSNDLTIVIDHLPRPIFGALLDQSIFPGEKFSLPFASDKLFTNPRGSFLQISASLSNSPVLPNWLHLSITPTLMNAYPVRTFVTQIIIDDDKAYLEVTQTGLFILDISNSDSITLLGKYNRTVSGIWGRQMTLLNNTVFILDFTVWELQIINVTNPHIPFLLSRYATSNRPRNFFIINNIAYIGGDYPALEIVDINNLTLPVQLSTYGDNILSSFVVVSDETVFLSVFSGVLILNATNIKNLTLQSTYPIDRSNRVWTINNIAFLGGRPILRGSTPLNGNGLWITGSTVFTPTSITNIANFSQPTSMGTFDVQLSDIVVIGNVAYGGGVSSLQIFDITQWKFSGVPQAGSGIDFGDEGNTQVRVTAADDVGGKVSSQFTIRVEGAPRFMVNVSTLELEAIVDQTLSFSIATIVKDPNNDPIIFTATQLDGSHLIGPSLNSISGNLLWTPIAIDLGNKTFLLHITDNIAGSNQLQVVIHVSQGPQVAFTIPNPPPAILNQQNVIYLPSNFIISPTGLALTYSANLLNGNLPLPSWILPNLQNPANLTFVVIPPFTGSTIVQITATDSHNTKASTSFTINAITNFPPQQVYPLFDQTATTRVQFSYQISKNTFVGADTNAPIYYGVSLIGQAPWLKWDAQNNVLHGKPGYGDTNIGSPRIITVIVAASNGPITVNTNSTYGQSHTKFNISVGGLSWASVGAAIAGPTIFVGGSAYGLFKKYQNRGVTASASTVAVGDQERYARKLRTSVADVGDVRLMREGQSMKWDCRFWRSKYVEIPGGDNLPDWLHYDDTTNEVRFRNGGPQQPGTWVIQVIDANDQKRQKVIEQFALHVKPKHQLASNSRNIEADEEVWLSDLQMRAFP